MMCAKSGEMRAGGATYYIHTERERDHLKLLCVFSAGHVQFVVIIHNFGALLRQSIRECYHIKFKI